MMNVDSCNHICTYVPPEMKATIDELTKRATEIEAEMVRQVVHCHTVCTNTRVPVLVILCFCWVHGNTLSVRKRYHFALHCFMSFISYK